jgi:hypothetical protein
MNSAPYETYLSLLAEGRRKAAGATLAAFLQSFNTSEEREQWTRTFLTTHIYGERVRHEIYAELIFPVLLAGSKRNDVWSLYWLAGTSQNLYRARELHEQVNFKGEIGFLKEAYAINHRSSEVREALLNSLLDYFRHASHEWPAGILWGMNGATLDQCDEIMSEVKFARQLDHERAHTSSLDEFEGKLIQYRERLISRSGNRF